MDQIGQTTACDNLPETVRFPKVKRGFGAMDPAKVREIASKGGKAAHAKGTAHQFNAEEARIAGSKGGKAPHKSRGRSIPPMKSDIEA